MPVARPGEVWMVDLGMVAKVRPCLVLTAPSKADELDVFTVVAHTTSLRGNRWEVSIQKSFFSNQGAFDVQRVVTVAGAFVFGFFLQTHSLNLVGVFAVLCDGLFPGAEHEVVKGPLGGVGGVTGWGSRRLLLP